MKPNVFVFFGILAAVCLATGCKHRKTDCCGEYPYDMHISAGALMQACQDLVKSQGASICLPGGNINFSQTHNVSSYMSASGFGYSNPRASAPNVVSFTTFYYEDSTIFRTIWGDTLVSFTYYGACIPNPILFPWTQGGGGNHLYELGLIPVADYQAGTAPRNFPGRGNRGVFKSEDITAIENIRLEPASGYINRNEPALYAQETSSKGFVCDVTLKGKPGKVPCYIITNYDGSGTLKWKVKKECQS
jgi:hypothetical protein